MTTLPPILNAPQVGMLIRRYKTDGWLIVEANPGEAYCYNESNGLVEQWSFGPGDELKWPNEPDTAWRSVFAEVKEEPRLPQVAGRRIEISLDEFEKRCRTILQYCDDGAEMRGVLCDAVRLAREYGDAMRFYGRQLDGTWRAVTSEPQDIVAETKAAMAKAEGSLSKIHPDGIFRHLKYVSRYAGLWEQHPDARWMATNWNGNVFKFSYRPIYTDEGIWIPPAGISGIVTTCRGVPRPQDSLEPRPEGV